MNTINILTEITNSLEQLSYKSSLGKSLKQTLKKFCKEDIINELLDVRYFYENIDILQSPNFEYRIKSLHSALLKYDKYYPDTQMKKCFNDLLGIRITVDRYEEILDNENISKFRMVDMRQGKSVDDGYRGIHLYYQKSNFHYPIEIQINSYSDRKCNDWLHTWIYKNCNNATIGCRLRMEYDKNQIKTENDFKKCAQKLLNKKVD